MPTYVMLFTKTDEGRKIDFEEVQSRRERGVELTQEYGGEVEALYYSNDGLYDFVAVAEFPDSSRTGATVRTVSIRANANSDGDDATAV